MNSVSLNGSITYPFNDGGKRRYVAGALFVLILLLGAFFSAEIVSVIYVSMLIICLVAANFKIKRGLISLVSPLFLLFVFGVLLNRSHPWPDVIKDAWYLLKIVVALGAGYLFMHYLGSLQRLFRLVVIASAILAMIHLFQVALVFQTNASLLDLRNAAGGGYFIPVVVLGLLAGIAQSRQFIGIGRWPYYLAIVLCAGSLIASASRTNIISLALIIIVMRGWGRLNLKTMLIFASLGAALAASFLTGALDANQLESNQKDVSLINKFARSATEVAIVDYEDMRDINTNWRGFESHRAYLTYLDGGLLEKVFGQGFGAMVDLGFYMPLGESEFRYIPVLHNGYMYVLVKYGLLGVLVYLFFIIRLVRVGSRVRTCQPVDLIVARRLTSSLGLVFLVSTVVISGLFNKSTFDSTLIILGATLAWYRMHDFRIKYQADSRNATNRRFNY